MDNVKGICNDIIPKNAMAIHNVLNNKGYDTYFVGGALRDYYINELLDGNFKIKDWDIVTTARYDVMQSLFNKILRLNENGRIVSKIGKTDLLIPKLETTGISINKQLFEVTPMNSFDGDEICFTNNIIEDLSKRDFTINTIAYSPKLGLISSFKTSEGVQVSAIEDIKNKVIKSTYNADLAFKRNRFNMIRAIIFANKYGFTIEEYTLKALKDNIASVNEINKGKLAVGFEKLMMCNFTNSVIYLKDTGILNALCEEWDDTYSDEIINLLVQLNELDKSTYIDRLKFIYNNFSNKELIIKLYKSFGVNKDVIYKIEFK